jgi:uncharacterized protein involved in exopolysaccharide biosynthesis
MLPAVVIFFAVCSYSVTMDETWEVSQAVMVRNNAVVDERQPGEFRGNDSMQTIEETIVEICMSNRVLTDTLKTVGPPADWSAADAAAWPTPKDVQQFRKAVSLDPPKGAEFGTTEVFYIKVRQPSQERAVALVEALFQHLRVRLGELRDSRASALLIELEKIVGLAKDALGSATHDLKAMEQTVGEDLVELRMLQSNSIGVGQRSRMLADMEQEIVRHRTQTEINNNLLELLRSTKDDPAVLVSAPPDLLTSYPVLMRLREGLISAQLRTAALRKNLKDEYPTVRAAVREEEAIRESIFDEVENAVRLVEADTQVRSGRLRVLDAKRDEMHNHLTKLADIRAEYSNLVNLVDIRQQSLKEAEQHLADGRARHAVARTSSLISPVDGPLRGHKPIGPGRLTVSLAGALGGIVCGFGILFLTVIEQPVAQEQEAVMDIVQAVPIRA